MADKNIHIDYWKREADRNWETARYLMNGHQNLMALFMFHMTIEKLMKAHWVKDNVDDFPPRIHDIQFLYNQTELTLPEWYDFMAVINNWNIDSRYPDYKDKIYSMATTEYVAMQFSKIEKLRECLLEAL
jgi:HEPN domain-containing protein